MAGYRFQIIYNDDTIKNTDDYAYTDIPKTNVKECSNQVGVSGYEVTLTKFDNDLANFEKEREEGFELDNKIYWYKERRLYNGAQILHLIMGIVFNSDGDCLEYTVRADGTHFIALENADAEGINKELHDLIY